jgi:glutathione synthase/RimK-type ligase-like ATP-grasp enzyme
VIRTPWDYTARYDEFIAWVRDVGEQRPMVNPAEVLIWNSHKSYLRDLAGRGIPVVPTAVVPAAAGEEARTAALGRYEGDIVIKPAISVGADQTLRVDASSPAAADHLGAITATGDALVQPFLPEITAGEVSLIYFGGEFSHAVRKTPTVGDFRVQAIYGGAVSRCEPSAAERSVAATTLAALGRPLAYARVDLVATSFGPMLMELELIEPQLFLDAAPGVPSRYAEVLATRLAV